MFSWSRNIGITKKKSPNAEETPDGAGQPFQALYDYTGSPDVPFLPDPRSELNIKRGDVFYLIHKRPEDGWCLVSTASASAVEGWVSALPKESLAPSLAYT